MEAIRLIQPKTICFGNDCAAQCVDDIMAAGLRRVFIVTSPPVLPLAGLLSEDLRQRGCAVETSSEVAAEPTIEVFNSVLNVSRNFNPDAVVGMGGGSALDTAKLVAGLHDSEQKIEQVFGINLLKGRNTFLACLPTTAGTGSEVSPNSILLDGREHLKRGVVSPFLVPDAAYVDPLLTLSVPPSVTASTGIDALTHCIEAYANRFAHPVVDMYALEGIRLISLNIPLAVMDGTDREARANMALGSLYGGLCLGPVNTAAVHALAYPLGGEYGIAHGVSNAMLLPHVLEFNTPAAPERYAEIAAALGVKRKDSALETTRDGVAWIRELCEMCGIPKRLSDMGVPIGAIPAMAESAMKVTRLLKNNPRELTASDAEAIYQAAY